MQVEIAHDPHLARVGLLTLFDAMAKITQILYNTPLDFDLTTEKVDPGSIGFVIPVLVRPENESNVPHTFSRYGGGNRVVTEERPELLGLGFVAFHRRNR